MYPGKAIARKSMRKLANECLKDGPTSPYILLYIGRIVRTEIKTLGNLQSNLCLKSFNWNMIYDELKAPVLLSVLMSATETTKPRNNRLSVIGVCAAVL